MYGTGTDESHQMEFTFVGFDSIDGVEKDFIFEKTAVLDRQRDAWHILINDTPSAHRHMTHFAVACGIPRQTNRNTRCLQCSHRIEAIQFFKCWQGGFANGVAMNAVADTPAIKNNENKRFVH